MVEADIARGTWEDREAHSEGLDSYAARWMVERQGLSERSVSCTRGSCGCTSHRGWGQSSSARSRRPWCGLGGRGFSRGGLGPSTVSKVYRLLRAVLNTAADDELIRRNPCRIKGAGVEHPAERPVLTLPEVMRLAEAIDGRYRVFVLLAVFGSLRYGELIALRRSDFELDLGLCGRAVSVDGRRESRQVVKRSKTPAGVRTVALPMGLVPELLRHLELYAERGDDGRVCVGLYGATPTRANFSAIWARAVKTAGLPGCACARSAAHRQSFRGRVGGEHPRADGSHGPRERGRRLGVPARHGRSGSRDRGFAGRDVGIGRHGHVGPLRARGGHDDELRCPVRFCPSRAYHGD